MSGFIFLVVSITGLGVTAGFLLAATLDQMVWATALPGIAGALLAGFAGLAGYALARDHTRVLLEREGLLAELEVEFHRLDEELRRVRTSGPRGERAGVDELERRIAALEGLLARSPVRVELSR